MILNRILISLCCCLLLLPLQAAPQPDSEPNVREDATADRASRSKSKTEDSSEEEAAAGMPENLAQDVMLQALGLIGVSYKWGGATPESGLDCSGFIRYVFKNALNIALPHNAFAISRLGEEVEKEELKPGDLVFFNTLGRRFSHVGIYLGDDRFIHSPRSGTKIQVVRMSDAYWVKRYNGARRVTQDSVTSRSPFLTQLMAEARAAEPRKKGKTAKKQAKKGKKKQASRSASSKKSKKKKKR